jgi:F-type H+-transporting ATPase subunit a
MLHEISLPDILFRLGPVDITGTDVYTVLTSLIIVGTALAVRAHLALRPSRLEAAVGLVLEHLEETTRDMLNRDPRQFTPLVVTLGLFIGVANLMGLVPGLRAPTADLSTTAALAIVVFVAVPFWGIRSQGIVGYLKHYLEPTPILLPLEILSDFTRTLTLAVRLFGNIMSEGLIIGVLLVLAGFLVPVPIMLLAVLTAVLQAYIFSVLTIVYLSAATSHEPSEDGFHDSILATQDS